MQERKDIMSHFQDSSIPLYYQLANILKEKIISGEYAPMDKLPTEKQLVNSYKISRVTVRQALQALENDGLIVRKRGKGSFVKNAKLASTPTKLTGSIEDIITMGIKTKAKVIDFSLVHPPIKVIKALNLDKDDKALKIERIRMIRNNVYSVTLNYVPADIGSKIGIEDIVMHALYNILEQKCEVKVARGTMVIEASIADSRIASLLNVMSGSPLLKIERTIFDSDDRPVDYVEVLYRADRYHYTVDLVRKKEKTKVGWEYQKPTMNT
jgi:GntR family transcriptional regulator